MSSITLPTEIWEEIFWYLPAETRRDLYPVNRALLKLALDERYRRVNLCLTWADVDEGFRLLRHLSYPHIATRVRHLTVCANWLSSAMYFTHERATLLDVLAYFLPPDIGRFIGPSMRRISNLENIDALMKSVVPCFPNVSSFDINGRYPFFQTSQVKSLSRTPNQPLLFNAWPAFASTLRRVSIHAEGSDMRPLLPPASCDLAHLEDVTLHFGSLPAHVPDLPPDLEAAHTFLCSISSSLRTLTLTFQDPVQAQVAVSTFFDALPHFPQLRSFSLHIPPLDAYNADFPAREQPATGFLNRHAETLHEVRIQPAIRFPLEPGSLETRSEPHLENLESLTLSSPSPVATSHYIANATALSAAHAHIQGSEDTLSSLSLLHAPLSLHDLKEILTLFTHRGKTRRLQKLEVWVRCLSPGLFDLVREMLPGLKEMRVDFAWLSPDEEEDGGAGHVRGKDIMDFTQEAVDAFLLSMKTRRYPDFNLLALRVNRDRRMCMSEKTAMKILEGVKPCIPALVDVAEVRIGEETWWRRDSGEAGMWQETWRNQRCC